jgi:hypothetical protein
MTNTRVKMSSELRTTTVVLYLDSESIRIWKKFCSSYTCTTTYTTVPESYEYSRVTDIFSLVKPVAHIHTYFSSWYTPLFRALMRTMILLIYQRCPLFQIYNTKYSVPWLRNGSGSSILSFQFWRVHR